MSSGVVRWSCGRFSKSPFFLSLLTFSSLFRIRIRIRTRYAFVGEGEKTRYDKYYFYDAENVKVRSKIQIERIVNLMRVNVGTTVKEAFQTIKK